MVDIATFPPIHPGGKAIGLKQAFHILNLNSQSDRNNPTRRPGQTVRHYGAKNDVREKDGET
jgi:hypothetical protein